MFTIIWRNDFNRVLFLLSVRISTIFMLYVPLWSMTDPDIIQRNSNKNVSDSIFIRIQQGSPLVPAYIYGAMEEGIYPNNPPLDPPLVVVFNESEHWENSEKNLKKYHNDGTKYYICRVFILIRSNKLVKNYVVYTCFLHAIISYSVCIKTIETHYGNVKHVRIYIFLRNIKM